MGPPRSEKQAEPDLKILARVETRFNDILVAQKGQMRELWFVRHNEYFLQSRIDIDRPDSLVLIYSKMMMGSLLFLPAPQRILMIGLGGAALPNFIQSWFPETEVDIVEIDPMVIHLAKKFFFFKGTDRCRVHEADGRVFLRQLPAAGYDVVFLDAFKSGSIPYHLKTLEYYKEIRRVMAPGGVAVSNLYGKSNRLKPRDIKTFAEVFGQVYAFEDAEEVATVLMAVDQDRQWSAEELRRSAAEFAAKKTLLLSMSDVAATYRPGKFEEQRATAFVDNFVHEEFPRAVEENNLNQSAPRPYPIKSVS
jgi:spermidine synthase